VKFEKPDFVSLQEVIIRMNNRIRGKDFLPIDFTLIQKYKI
jgi:hypothetical protein